MAARAFKPEVFFGNRSAAEDLGVEREASREIKQESPMQNAGAVLMQFYDAVKQRDMARARGFLDDNLTFVGLFETYRSADSYIATFTQLLQIVTRLDVKVIIGEGDNAAIFFELETTAPAAGTTLVAEWHQTRDGKIVRAQSAFDGRPFAALFSRTKDSTNR
jgi:hypothetical protein